MDKELIEKCNNVRYTYLLEINALKAKKNRLEKLKEDPTVQKYFELLDEPSVKEYLDIQSDLNSGISKELLNTTEEDIFNAIFYNLIRDVRKTNEIYVCFGKNYNGYQTDYGDYGICVPADDTDLKCAEYKNLESWDNCCIFPSDQCEEFESKHTVLPGIYTYEEYKKLSMEYILDILRVGNEDATRKLLQNKMKNN